jgi:hypothetical protein
MKNRERAADLLSRYPEEDSGCTFAWARVLERWLAGDLAEAHAALASARDVNPYADRYFSGKVPMPREAPEYYSPGDDTEAQLSARELAAALENNPGFREWLRACK